ncbi:MAG: ribose-5-phosphate isomerase RpiA [Lactobacillus sp.]|nr:ribose-5-phosphate isomerase RpiA [Lactobacillus sp.]MDN6052077.1 ribose-5-phosphate isomerase RpiA [Lactobacillus sp.]
MTQAELKAAAAQQAAQLVQPSMVLGVGTGSTVAYLIAALGKRRATGLTLAAVVTTSNRSKEQLDAVGFKVSPLAAVAQVDLTIDGSDRVAPNLDGIKGGGGALTLEKNVAVNSKRVVWIVDESKVVPRLGGFPLPVEVLPISCEQNFRRFEQEGLQPQYRLTPAGQRYVTHYGNYIIDLAIDPIPAPHGLAAYLDQLTGVVEHGLFLDICDEVIIAHRDGQIESRQK